MALNDYPKTLQKEDDDALSKILSTILMRNSASGPLGKSSVLALRSPSEKTQNDVGFLKTVEQRWPSPIPIRKPAKDKELSALLSKAQQHFVAIGALQDHMAKVTKYQKGLSRPISSKAQAKTKVVAGFIEEATVQSELSRTFHTLKELHQKLKEGFDVLESREARVQSAERVLSTARSTEFLQLATEIPVVREQLNAKSSELAKLEEELLEERDILIQSVKELQDIRAKIEGKDVKVQQETITANELRLRLQVDKLNLEAALGDLARRQRLQEERSQLIESAELELARGKFMLNEREYELRAKVQSLQEIKRSLDAELRSWEAELGERERVVSAGGRVGLPVRRPLLKARPRYELLDRELEEILQSSKRLREQEAEQQRAWAPIHNRLAAMDGKACGGDRDSPASPSLSRVSWTRDATSVARCL